MIQQMTKDKQLIAVIAPHIWIQFYL